MEEWQQLKHTWLFEIHLALVSDTIDADNLQNSLIMTLRTIFGPSPLVKVRSPSSRPIRTSASNACAYPNLWVGNLAPSAHILTSATWSSVSNADRSLLPSRHTPRWDSQLGQPGRLRARHKQSPMDWTVVVVLFVVESHVRNNCTGRISPSSMSTAGASKLRFPTTTRVCLLSVQLSGGFRSSQTFLTISAGKLNHRAKHVLFCCHCLHPTEARLLLSA